MKTLRYVNLGEVDPNFIDTIWEYSRLFSSENPVLFSFFPNELMILISNLYRLEKYLNTDKLPANIKKSRLYRVGSGTGVSLWDAKEVLIFCLHYPFINGGQPFRQSVTTAVTKAVNKYGIKVLSKGNDLFFEKEGKWKKFSGWVLSKDGKMIRFNKCKTIGGIVTLDFNVELARKIYKIDSDKFLKKGIKDIGDVVGGLHEVNPNIKLTIADEIAQEIAKSFNLELKEDSLTTKEMGKMKVLADELNNDNWKLYSKHPEIK